MGLRFPSKVMKECGKEWAEMPEKEVRKVRRYLLEKRLREGEEAFGITHGEWRTYEPFHAIKAAELAMCALRAHHYWKRFEFRITPAFTEG